MSSVNFLEKLLDGTEIKWKALREVAEVRSGWGFPNSYQGQVEGAYPFYKVSDMNTVGNETTMYVANNYIDNAIAKKLGVNPAPEGTVIFPKIGAAIATNKKRLLSRPSAYDNNVMGLIAGEQLNFRFLFHWMKTIDLSSIANDSGALPSIRKSDMENLQIPIPCPDNPKKSLEIQAEIVRILDAMTAHTAELAAELAARKKQYNYYRDKLLSFEDGEVEWLDLDTLTKIKTGQSVNKQMISDNPGEYAVINSGREPLGFIDLWNTDNDPIGITSRGAGVGSITWREGKYFRGNLNYSVTIKNKDKISIRYLYHILQKMQLEIQALCTFDGIPALNASNLKTLEIPVPSLDEQNRIVAILDKFDALTASITEGLPCEIELREKQYAYYRDLLLNFSQPNKG